MVYKKETPPWPLLGEWPKGHRDFKPPELPEVKAWIGSTLGATDVQLVNCFAVNSWSITALFQVEDSSIQVFFKAVLLELFSKHPLICELLQKCCSEAVPELVGSRTGDYGAWTLFRSISGQSVQEIGHKHLLVEMAKTLAKVQTNFAELSDERILELSRFGSDRLVEMLEFLIKRLRDYYLPV